MKNILINNGVRLMVYSFAHFASLINMYRTF